MGQLDRFHPIGTPDELEEMGISGREYFSCSAPAQGNRGCRHYGHCTMPFKGKPKQAPENLGIYRESWQSGRIKTMVMPCHRYYDHKKEWEESKDTLHIIAAAEGSGMKASPEMPMQETYEEQRETQVSTLSGRSMPVVKHRIIKRPVPKFERPREVDPERDTASNIRGFLQQYAAEQAQRELVTGKRHGEGESIATIPFPVSEEPREKSPPSRPTR